MFRIVSLLLLLCVCSVRGQEVAGVDGPFTESILLSGKGTDDAVGKALPLANGPRFTSGDLKLSEATLSDGEVELSLTIP
jgi:hypothetical protein